MRSTREGDIKLTEQDIQNKIRLALSQHGVVFRTNAGEFWQGELAYSREFKQRVLINLRRVEGLPKGFPDLLFLGPGQVAFIECKTEAGRLSEEQRRFSALLDRYQLPHGTARSPEDALKIINKGDNHHGI